LQLATAHTTEQIITDYKYVQIRLAGEWCAVWGPNDYLIFRPHFAAKANLGTIL